MNERSLEKIEQQSKTIVFKTSTVFPFTLFPDTIEVSEQQLTITYRYFFWSSQIIPIRISDLLNVAVSTNLLFGSIRIQIVGYETNPPIVHYLPRKDAIRLEEILTGLIAAQKENADLDQYTPGQLRRKLANIGASQRGRAPVGTELS